MFCIKCGTQNQDNSFFCAMCGERLRPKSEHEASPVQNAEAPQNLAEQTPSADASAPVFAYQTGEYAYARIASQKDGSYYCECIDNTSAFFVGQEFAKRPDLTPAMIGDYIWAYLKEFHKTVQNTKRYKVIAVTPYSTPSSNAITREFHLFSQYHQKGDLLRAPISSVREDYLTVQLSPNLTGICYTSDLPRSANIVELKSGAVNLFLIHQIIPEKNRVVLRLQGAGEQDKRNTLLWNQLPASIREVRIPNKILEVILEQDDYRAVVQKIGTELTVPGLSAFLEPLYQAAYRDKQITIKQSATTYFMDFDTGLKNTKGAPISAGFKKLKHDTVWVMNLFGFTSVESVFDRFVYAADMNASLNELAALALSGEEWDYGGVHEKGKKFILKQYLRFNFYKSKLDNLLITSEKTGDAVFNTGLVDAAYDEIFCYLKRNTDPEDFYCRKWELGFFACWGKGKNGKKLNDLFDTRPSAPQYIDPNRVQDIYYDITKPLSCDYDHIIADNLGRLPLDFIRRKLSYSPDVVGLINAYEASHSPKDFEALRKIILNDENYLRDVVDGLKMSVETAKKHCKWNYKTAIPIYYPRNNNVSLLLPLCLSNDNSKADVALVVERLENGNYQGQTILTLQMAYLDARQICRPNSEWLTVNSIDETADEADEDYSD